MNLKLESLQTQRIGHVDLGIDGMDEYLLVTNLEDDLAPDDAVNLLMPLYYDKGRGPGAYFCHNIRAVQAPYSTNSVIAIVEHRYDV
jgi:hypothetical protein